MRASSRSPAVQPCHLKRLFSHRLEDQNSRRPCGMQRACGRRRGRTVWGLYFWRLFGACRQRTRALSDATLRFDLALGVRRRHAPKVAKNSVAPCALCATSLSTCPRTCPFTRPFACPCTCAYACTRRCSYTCPYTCPCTCPYTCPYRHAPTRAMDMPSAMPI